MRMIGIGLTGFLLAGIALLLSTMNILEQGQRYIRNLAGEPQLVFEHRLPASAPDTYRAVIARATPDHPVLLSGLPAYQSVAFIMPVDARPTSGYLQIDATSQVLDGVEGVLRISIRNTKRGELLLHPGEAGRSLQIPLTYQDFAGDRLVVSFSLQGAGPHLRCGPQDGVAAIVEIETTSAVFLTLERPLDSPRDRVHAWGNVVRVAWPEWLKHDEQLRRLVLATEFRHRGLTPVFATAQQPDPGLTTVELREALPAFPIAPKPPLGPSAFAETGANGGLRRFYRQVTWREGYALGAAAGPYLPAQLDLSLLLGRLPDGQAWALTVSLNKRLIFQDHLPGTQAEFQALIDLPAEIQGANNMLEVVATTKTPQNGVCDQGPELVAELLPQTRLILGDTPFLDPITELHTALRKLGPVNIALTSDLTARDADAASQLLSLVIPTGVDFKPAGSRVHITVLAPGQAQPPLPDNGPAWLVTSSPEGPGLAAVNLRDADAVHPTGLALLVTPGPAKAEAVEG